MKDREIAIVVALLLLLFLLERRRGAVTATIYGADVAPGVDVFDGGPMNPLGWQE